MGLKKSGIIGAALLALGMLNASAIAHEGGISDGGGNAVGPTLLDFFENEGTTQFDPTQTAAYRQVVAEIFRGLDSRMAALTQRLQEGLHSKRWYFEPKPLAQSQGCLNSTLIKAAQQIVACQSEREIRIYQPWYDQVDLRNQAGVIMHELLVFQLLKKNLSAAEWITAEREARAFNRQLFSTLPDASELQDAAWERMGWTDLRTNDYYRSRNDYMRIFTRGVCAYVQANRLEIYRVYHGDIVAMGTQLYFETWQRAHGDATPRDPKWQGAFDAMLHIQQTPQLELLSQCRKLGIELHE